MKGIKREKEILYLRFRFIIIALSRNQIKSKKLQKKLKNKKIKNKKVLPIG